MHSSESAQAQPVGRATGEVAPGGKLGVMAAGASISPPHSQAVASATAFSGSPERGMDLLFSFSFLPLIPPWLHHTARVLLLPPHPKLMGHGMGRVPALETPPGQPRFSWATA